MHFLPGRIGTDAGDLGDNGVTSVGEDGTSVGIGNSIGGNLNGVSGRVIIGGDGAGHC